MKTRSKHSDGLSKERLTNKSENTEEETKTNALACKACTIVIFLFILPLCSLAAQIKCNYVTRCSVN